MLKPGGRGGWMAQPLAKSFILESGARFLLPTVRAFYTIALRAGLDGMSCFLRVGVGQGLEHLTRNRRCAEKRVAT